MKTIFLALQDSSTRSWFPVARVDRFECDKQLLGGDEEGELYLFRYTKGVTRFPEFQGFGRMNKFDVAHYSAELFPLLKNRVIARNRGDFSAFARWVGKDASELTFFDELAVTGGLRGTDSIELIPVPDRTPDGMYKASFFVHGARYLSEREQVEFANLTAGAELVLVPEFNNEIDQHALLLKRSGSTHHVGYVPRYFSKDFSALLEAHGGDVHVTVSRVNPDAPLAFRVLCEFESPWPEGFNACREAEYELYAESPAQVKILS